MRILKSKFAAAIVLAGLMFGFLSFSTAPVVAQDTTSDVVTAPNTEVAALPGVVIFVVRVAAWAVGYELGTRLIGGNPLAHEFPADTLD